MEVVKVFISSVQREFAKERRQLCDYIRNDSLLGRFFEPFIFAALISAFRLVSALSMGLKKSSEGLDITYSR